MPSPEVPEPVTRVYEFGPFRLDTGEHALFRDGRPVPLTPKAYETLLALVRQTGSLVLKERLMETVWPGLSVAENNLNQSVSALRKALGQEPAGPQYIETVPRRGYRFVAAVRTPAPVVAGVSATDPFFVMWRRPP